VALYDVTSLFFTGKWLNGETEEVELLSPPFIYFPSLFGGVNNGQGFKDQYKSGEGRGSYAGSRIHDYLLQNTLTIWGECFGYTILPYPT